MDLRSIFVANGTGIIILIILNYVAHSKTIRNHAEDKIFSFMVYGVMLGCFMEVFSYVLDGRVFPGSIVLNYIANTYLFSVNLLLPFCVLIYVDLTLYDDSERIWKYYKPQIFIGLIMFSLNIVNYFIPITYYISAQNVYERRPVSYLYYVVILYYCISAMLVTRRYEKDNGAKAFFNINAFLFPIIAGAGLQFAFYGLSLAWLAAAVGLMGLYMMQQNEMAYVDSLTDTYNRQYLNHILSAWTSRSISFAGVMLDVDHFKWINDQHGHSEGDKVLKVIADLLKESRQDKEWVFRFGGDEFIILKRTESQDGLVPYMEEVERRLVAHNRIDPTHILAISYGTSFFKSGNIDRFMKEMDDKMYEMKEEHHSENQQ